MLYFQDYKSFIEEANNGVILFSLGFTGFDSKDVPTDVVSSFLSAFGKVEQRVIMRFDPKYLPEVPDNVMAAEWIPQQEILGICQKIMPLSCISLTKTKYVTTFLQYILYSILAHKNTVLFVSHCGMTGILEAIYHRVPIVGIANFADQVDNAIRIQDKGLGISISKHNLNSKTILMAIHEVLKNER